MASSLTVNPADLDVVLQDLVDFAVANAGFTDEGNVGPVLIDFNRNGEDPASATSGNVYRISKDGIFWHFGYSSFRTLNTSNGNCELFGAIMATALQTAMNGGNNSGSDTQGEYVTYPVFTLSGPYENAYYYSQGSSVHMVLETTPNAFLHVNIGTADKFGSFIGGQFLTGSIPVGYSASLGWDNDISDMSPPFPETASTLSVNSGFMYLPNGNPDSVDDRDDFAPFCRLVGNNTASKQYVTGTIPWSGNESDNVADDPDNNAYSTQTKSRTFYGFPLLSGRQVPVTRTVSFPILLKARNLDNDDEFLTNTGNDDKFPMEFLGSVNGVRVTNMYSASPKDIIDTNWRVFPVFQKTGSAFSGPITGELGIAYLED